MSCHILAILRLQLHFSRQIFHGVSAFATTRPDWRISAVDFRDTDRITDRIQDYDGFLIGIPSLQVVEQISRIGKPIVQISGASSNPTIPTVRSDDQQVGIMAADHLASTGLFRYAYWGPGKYDASYQRAAAMLNRLVELKATELYAVPGIHQKLPEALQTKVKAYTQIEQLPRPIAVMAFNDLHAQTVLEQCDRSNIVVPDHLCVLGVDNDDLYCATAKPPLSSIDTNGKRLGYDASHMLAALIDGRQPESMEIRIPPLRVVPRISTDRTAQIDPLLAKALSWIDLHVCEPISVEDLIQHIPTSRRNLEYRFRRLLGHSPYSEILRRRIEHVKQLLCQTDLPMGEIASRTGFRHQSHLTSAFKRMTGMTPTAYRRQLGTG